MRRLAALCLAATALAAGCGGDEGEDYESDVREVSQQLRDSDVGAELQNVRSGAELAATLRKAAGLLDDAAGDLGEIEPPDDAAAAHQKVIDGARETADTFREVARQARFGNAQDMLASLAQLTGSGGAVKLEQGLRELERKGYEVQAAEDE